ncbi:MAG: hypothetical protein R2705_15735 [Ilumatobacteraceae bacterium]
MKVLVATKPHAEGPEEFFHAVDGELVTPLVLPCDAPDRCGCGRGFVGLGSGRSTSSATVCDLPHLGVAHLRDAVTRSLERSGWLHHLAPDDQDDLTDAHVESIRGVADAFEVGTILARHEDLVTGRADPPSSPRRDTLSSWAPSP